MNINRSNVALAIAAAIAISTHPAWAGDTEQRSPYAGEQQRALKAVSAQDIADLEAGRGMGLSKVAELNHYPGPKHVLDAAKSLKLADTQIQQVRQLQEGMQHEAQRLGTQILAKEAELDSLFSGHNANEDQVHTLVADIAKLQGELRFVHVNAHLATTRLLTSEQILAYDQLRGYTDSTSHHHH
ncbi:hypothetical protein [Ralstonia sp. RL]|uniref:Spy/CpxP family protein refolding chaperone n=1 Tax=Ralstonia sp. RL TaxID=1839756 RepID=UPI00257BFCF1|nr:hypothetical protein [Ralstonia sp. RL]